MAIHRDFPYILILLSIPFQFNMMADAVDPIISSKIIEWKTKKYLTYYETYFARKLTYYFGIVSAILFIFIYYKYKKMRLIISINFILSGLTWLLYFAVTEKNIIILFIIRCLQGIYVGALQISHFSYVMFFANSRNKCFYGCLTQFAMFLGLSFMNLLFSFVNWKTAVIVFFVENIIFGGLIWLVPEHYIKPKSITKESIFSKPNLKLLLIGIVLMLLQLLSGISILLNDLSEMLQGIGVNFSPQFESFIFDFIGAFATLITSFIIDALSSKFMWCVSSFGLCIGLMVYAITLKIQISHWVGTLSVFIYFLFYGLGEGPIPWCLASTLFPDNIRLECSAILTSWNLFIPQILDLIWINLNKAAGHFGSIIFCSTSCLIGIVFGFFFIPIDHTNIYEDNKNVF